MVTHLRTVKNEEIVVPNATIINSNIVNYNTLAASRGLILHTTVGIGYETPWRQVEAMLRLAAERTSGLLKELAPFVLRKSVRRRWHACIARCIRMSLMFSTSMACRS